MVESRTIHGSPFLRRFVLLYGVAELTVVAGLALAIQVMGGDLDPQERNRLSTAVVVVGIIGLLVIRGVGGRFQRALSDLGATAGAIAEGDLFARSRRSGIDQLDLLGASLTKIAVELGSRAVAGDRERQTLTQVLDALALGVILIGPDQRIVLCNRPAVSLLGRRPDTVAVVTPVSLQRLMRAALESEVDEEIEHGAPTRALRVSGTPLEGGRGLLVVEDVTESRRVEAMRRDFVADASHELKTPVASILASAEALELALEHRPEDGPRFAGQVSTAARRLGRIVEDLLDLSRLESSGGQRAVFRIDLAVADEIDRMRRRAEEAGIWLELELDAVEVNGSEPDLRLAVRNLCDNAIRYSGRGETVTVRVSPVQAGAMVEVSDTGSGIPQRAIPRIFERFYRVDVARSRDTGGTGLGLAIVKHVVEGHRGSVSVSSRLGEGSTFRIYLPNFPDDGFDH